jgi:hypothetical protein
LLYVIASIVLLGTVGGGVAYFSSSLSTSNIAKTAHNQAYYAAVSGLRYAGELSWDQIRAIENNTATYSLGTSVSFKLTVGTQSPQGFPVTSCGIYGAGGSMEANHQLPMVSVIPSGPDPEDPEEPDAGYDINLPGDNAIKAGANSNHGTDVAGDLIDVVTAGHPDYTGVSYIRLGNRTTEGHACIWFSDSKTVQNDTTYCRNGVCKFGKGFRLYFEFQVVSPGADGFTLAFINASNNTVHDCGGDLDMGELLGYAGPGVSGHGLRPAKIALEIDTFQNGTGNCEQAGSRNDDDDGHVAYVYWGKIHGDWPYECLTYDDNIHGVSGGDNGRYYDIDGNYLWRGNSPIRNTTNLDNTKSKSGSSITYKNFSNLEDGAIHTVRMEVTRGTNSNGSGAYTMKTWIDCAASGGSCDGLKDLTTNFTAKSPSLITSFTMDKYFHNLFSTFLLGFTEATGANAQEVRLMNFRLRFRE